MELQRGRILWIVYSFTFILPPPCSEIMTTLLSICCTTEVGTKFKGTIGKRGIKENSPQWFRLNGQPNVKKAKPPCKSYKSNFWWLLQLFFPLAFLFSYNLSLALSYHFLNHSLKLVKWLATPKTHILLYFVCKLLYNRYVLISVTLITHPLVCVL